MNWIAQPLRNSVQSMRTAVSLDQVEKSFIDPTDLKSLNTLGAGIAKDFFFLDCGSSTPL
jgi:hypothetical protein